jgi:prepilin-type N-terminal cleavage/methylation domain-containing protein
MERDHVQRGFTLIESVTALSIAGILLVALGSVMSMSLRAMPRPEEDVSALAAGVQDAAAWLGDDLAAAVSVSSISATDLEFTVADRDNDGSEEEIHYSWDGPGEPLMRSMNDGTEIAVGPALSSFSAEAVWRSVTKSGSGSSALGAEEAILRYPGASNATQSLAGGAVAVTFTPVLDADATSWRVTSCRVLANVSAVTVSTLRARLYSGRVTNLASQTPLATSGSVGLNVLGSAMPITFTFSSAPDLPAGTQVSIVIDATVTVGDVNVQYNSSGVAMGTLHATVGKDGSWTTYTDGGAPVLVNGRQWRPSTTTSSESRLMSVGIEMIPQQSKALPVRFSVSTFAEPITK